MLSLLLSVAVACNGGDATPASSSLPTETITFSTAKGQSIRLLVEIADTTDKRARGLMFRDSLPENQGMLFKFETETQAGFWMKDTRIPLSIGFISADRVIIDILDMQPLSTTLHSPSRPYTLAVEANQGWFAENGVEVGSKMEAR